MDLESPRVLPPPRPEDSRRFRKVVLCDLKIGPRREPLPGPAEQEERGAFGLCVVDERHQEAVERVAPVLVLGDVSSHLVENRELGDLAPERVVRVLELLVRREELSRYDSASAPHRLLGAVPRSSESAHPDGPALVARGPDQARCRVVVHGLREEMVGSGAQKLVDERLRRPGGRDEHEGIRTPSSNPSDDTRPLARKTVRVEHDGAIVSARQLGKGRRRRARPAALDAATFERVSQRIENTRILSDDKHSRAAGLLLVADGYRH